MNTQVSPKMWLSKIFLTSLAPTRDIGLTLCGILIFFSQSLQANHANPTDFVRFLESDQGDQLQTAIVSYEDSKQRRVDLIGAIHIADASYYHKLNQLFKDYEVVLYELVGGPYKSPTVDHEEVIVTQQEPESFALKVIHQFYDYLRNTLKLSFQLDEVDYLASNFIHADVTHKEFANLQKEKNESFFQLWMKSMRSSLTTPTTSVPQPGILQILEIMQRQDSDVELKRILGKMFDEIEVLIGSIEAQGETVILTERNRVLLKKLSEQLSDGKTSIGIFYGSAHFIDVEQRLQKLGFKKTQSRWQTAWDLPPPAKPAPTPLPTSEQPTETKPSELR